MDKLSWREIKAVRGFAKREVLYAYHLPGSVGRKTMEQLVLKGLIEVFDTSAGRYSTRYGWRLVR